MHNCKFKKVISFNKAEFLTIVFTLTLTVHKIENG